MAIKSPGISTKRLAIIKANTQMVVVISIASFVTVFCLVASKTVWSQNQYQSRLTSAEDKTHQQLEANIQSFGTLMTSYNAFNSTATNVIGGNTNGTGNNDGPNSKIILDALPSKYDFPALAASVEDILVAQGLSVDSITGTDNQLSEQNNNSSPNPQPVNMPFTFSVNNANYGSLSQLITKLQQSIRPIQVDTIDLTGTDNDMTMTVDAHTYYQPGKSVSITKEVIR